MKVLDNIRASITNMKTFSKKYEFQTTCGKCMNICTFRRRHFIALFFENFFQRLCIPEPEKTLRFAN